MFQRLVRIGVMAGSQDTQGEKPNPETVDLSTLVSAVEKVRRDGRVALRPPERNQVL